MNFSNLLLLACLPVMIYAINDLPLDGTYHIRNRQTGFVLDALTQTAAGDLIVSFPLNDPPFNSQIWRVSTTVVADHGDVWTTFQDTNSGLLLSFNGTLAVPNGNVFMPHNGAACVLGQGNSMAGFLDELDFFVFEVNTFEVTPPLLVVTGQTAIGSPVIVAPFTDSHLQHWEFLPATPTCSN